jgi:putative hydrolase of the HAD superfamily
MFPCFSEFPYNTGMHFTTFFFDLDETIYPHSAGLWEVIGGRITRYMIERVGIPQDKVMELRDKYFLEYGTTLRGLQANHSIDMKDYLAFVHDVPLEKYISPNPALPVIIEAIPARKYIFTNADANHANRVLNYLGLRNLFAGIIDVHVIAPYCKPMPEAFTLALKFAGNPQPKDCVLLDDQGRVTRAAKSVGMYTILVGKETPGQDADASLMDITGIDVLLEKLL